MVPRPRDRRTRQARGPRVGGLLNATFGNATELIIAVFALSRGLTEVVKASLTGSIVGNLLLVLGLSMLAGGVKYKTQHFSREASGIQITDRKSTRLNSSHVKISYAVFC